MSFQCRNSKLFASIIVLLRVKNVGLKEWENKIYSLKFISSCLEVSEI